MVSVDGTLAGAAGGLKIRVEELKTWSQWQRTGKFSDEQQISKIAAFIQWDIDDTGGLSGS